MAHLDSEVKEECLREDLRFYFMNPCEKFRARQQIPWKMGLQILKIVMVTTQLVRFGLSNQLVVAFKEENTAAFKHLFLKGYSGSDEDDYSCSFHRLRNLSLGTLGYGESEDNRIALKVCKQHYKKGTMFPSNETLNIDSDIEIVDISFQLKGIDLQTIHSRELPDCYIVFDNKAHSGKIKIYFNSDAKIEECKDLKISGSKVSLWSTLTSDAPEGCLSPILLPAPLAFLHLVPECVSSPNSQTLPPCCPQPSSFLVCIPVCHL
ncbi:MCOLN2, partial [Cervus elaphus hippelaphus]